MYLASDTEDEMAELGSFKACKNAKQMIKMAGNNPIESESAGKKRYPYPDE